MTIAPLYEYPNASGLEIAVIGLGCRFPGANNIDSFWQNLISGKESISFFNKEELRFAGVSESMLGNANFVNANGIIDYTDKFDAEFFGYTPNEAELLDPQQRIFLEVAWEAMENAGINLPKSHRNVGVYAGVGISQYLINNLLANNRIKHQYGLWELMLANGSAQLATRLSYLLNLHGPSLTLNTACSTSLVVIHTACRALLNGECNTAIAGAICLDVPQKTGYFYQEGGVVSKDGHCRPFDQESSGTVSGNGIGIVVLKCLENAIEDGDRIDAIIKSSAINNDGKDKVGFTAPSVTGQAKVIAAALDLAEIDPNTIGYIEAHGTGTALGDPIEIAALTQAFQGRVQECFSCPIGSVKANIGHLDTAAGMAGFIKTILILKNGKIPPNINFTKVNSKIDFNHNGFYVNQKILDWSTQGVIRRAGVSSFGIGGTNAHVVLEESPKRLYRIVSDRNYHLLCLSAKSDFSLDKQGENLSLYLREHPEVMVNELAYTLQFNRQVFSHKRIFIASSREDAIAQLSQADHGENLSLLNKITNHSIVFLFAGQGAQYVDMGRTLFEKEKYCKKLFLKCDAFLQQQFEFSIVEILFPKKDKQNAQFMIDKTLFAQISLFVVEYVLASYLIALGVKPIVMMGHSLGEYVCATLAGVFSLEDSLKIIYHRGRLMQSMQVGKMLAVQLSEAEIKPYLGVAAYLAAVNEEKSCVISGHCEVINDIQKQLDSNGIKNKVLNTSHAFHSSLMQDAAKEFLKYLSAYQFKSPGIPYISNVTGNWVTPELVCNPDYWVKHMLQPIRFYNGASVLLELNNLIGIEIGPGNILMSMLLRHSKRSLDSFFFSLLPDKKVKQLADKYFMQGMGKLWLHDVVIDFSLLNDCERNIPLSLPPYPFHRKTYWIYPDYVNNKSKIKPITNINLEDKLPIRQWFYRESWEQFPLLNMMDLSKKTYVIFMNQKGFSDLLADRLTALGNQVIKIKDACSFFQNDNEFTLDINNMEHYEQLCFELKRRDLAPDCLIYARSLTTQLNSQDFYQLYSNQVREHFFVLLYFIRSCKKNFPINSLDIKLISRNSYNLFERDFLYCNALPMGLLQVANQEYGNIYCSNIDIEEQLISGKDSMAFDSFICDLINPSTQPIIAYRGDFRWFSKIKLRELEDQKTIFKRNGVYVISGGLGKIGLLMVNYLAQQYYAKIIILSRSVFPKQTYWTAILKNQIEKVELLQKLKVLEAAKNAGGNIEIYQVDIANADAVRQVLQQTIKKHGVIHGVIHAAANINHGKSKSKISQINKQHVEDQFYSKIDGAIAIAKATEYLSVGFCLMMSSLAVYLGGLGFAAYSTANQLMDQFAIYMNKSRRTKWLTLNWDGWEFDITESQETPWITSQEGLYALEEALKQNESRLLISTTDYFSRVGNSFANKKMDGEMEAEVIHDRPVLLTSYKAPNTVMEHSICAIWQDIFGIEKIGIHDNFFELGGHSLLAMQIMARLRERFKQKISLSLIFETQTIAQLAAHLTALITKQENNMIEGEV